MARQILPATIRQRQSPLAGLTWHKGLPVVVVLGVACLLLLALSGDIKSWMKAPLSSPTARNLSEALYSHASPSSKGAALASDVTGDDTLVLYLYDNSDPVYSDNFRFFLQEGVAAHDGCQYIIVVPDALLKGKHLPKLPENAKFFSVDPAACHFGLGTLGLVLKSEKISDDSFKHFIFASSRARGPFMAPYLQSTMHWTRLFTRLLNEDIKLVGPTVSCQNVLHGVDPSLTVNLTSVPHVQFTAMATDQEGFRLMQQQRTIFQCHHAAWEDEYWSVMQASHVMVNSSHNLAAFMARYQGVDWRNTKNWDCNSRLNPVGEFFYDGSTITPFEVMFVTMNSMIVENNWSFARQALLYQNWMSAQDTDTLDVNTNFWVTDPWSIKHQRIAYMQSRGPGCFDHRYYLKKNPDLAVLKTVLELWDHFVMLGQFEGRSYRRGTVVLHDFQVRQAVKQVRAPAGKKLDPESFLEQHCNAVKADHAFAVDEWLHPFRPSLSAHDIVTFKHPEWWSATHDGHARLPLLFSLGGKLHLHPTIAETPDGLIVETNNYTGRGNMGWFHINVLNEVMEQVAFDDFVLASSPYAMPMMGHLQPQFPYLSCCNRRGFTSTLLIPSDLEPAQFLEQPLRSGADDARDPRAIFLGSPTGWENGKRRAVCRAGAAHPEALYTGITTSHIDGRTVDREEAKLFVKEGQTMQWQVDHFQHIVSTQHHLRNQTTAAFLKGQWQTLQRQLDNFQRLIYADGHCGSLRQRDLLSSDATVLALTSLHEMWFTPLLLPWTHYVPVHYEPEMWPEGSNLHEAWMWASRHPAEAAKIVRSARAFSQLHFTRLAQTCYVVHLLHEYSKLMSDRDQVPELLRYNRPSTLTGPPIP